MDTATNVLATRAVLAGVTVRFWTAEVIDRKVTAKTNQAHGAAPDAGKYRKALVAPEAIEPIKQAARRVREIVYAMTLPWTDEGLRVLPVKNAEAFNSQLKDAKAEFDYQAAQFMSDYPLLKERARARLGDMFAESDYPAKDDLARKFSIEPRLVPIPSADDFRCQMGAEALAAARKALDEANREALRAATLDAWRQARAAVATMADKLAGYSPDKPGEKARGIFRDSLVSNVIEIAMRLPNLNIAEDPRMVKIADLMESELCYFSADDLRRDDSARETVIGHAKRVVSAIDQIVGAL